jgi:hypothetical protein
MPFPKSQVISRQSPVSRSAPIQSGTMFAVGMADRGPTGAVAEAHSLQQFVEQGGERVAYGILYDAADVFFREGGAIFKWVRVVGPAAKVANKTLQNGASENTLKVLAVSPGEWANNITVEIKAGEVGGNYIITVKEGTKVLEVSPELVDNTAAIAWASKSKYIRVEDLGKGDPKNGSFTLTEGADDHASATDTEWLTALNVISKSEGPGQVTMPGRATTTAHKQLLEHAEARNRFAILDGTDTATAATLISMAATDRALAQARYGAMFGAWRVVPGIAAGTFRTVPPSCVVCGIIARNHAGGFSPNIAAAGDRYGQSNYTVELSKPEFSDSDKDLLYDGGVNIANMRNGVATQMGFRTLVNGVTDATWLLATNARLYMEIAAKADAIAGKYLFEQIDGKGITFAKFNGELRGMLLPYFANDALYGHTFDEAAFVDTGAQVNTPTTIAGRQINAVIEVRMSPFGETVSIYVSKVATTEAV